MGNGLKKALGLGEPSKKEAVKLRTEQGKAFDKAFRATLKRLNGHLEYTAIRADEARHSELAQKRELSCSAYRVAVKKIDPANPAAAQESLDQVTNAIERLEENARVLHEQAERHYSAWVAKGPLLDAAADQVADMVDWGHSKGATLQHVIDGINKQANLRRYQDATDALDQFVVKLEPIITEFTAQADAKIAYDAMMTEQQMTIADFKAVRFVSLADWQVEIQGNLDAIQQAADNLDYVTALADLEPEQLAVEEFLGEAAELQRSKDEYDTARAELQTRLDKGLSWNIMQVQENIDRLQAAMEKSAEEEDFVGALSTLKELSPEVDLKLKLIDKSVYDSAVHPHVATFTAADGTIDPGHYTITKAVTAYSTVKQELDALVASEKWSEASAKLPGTVTAAQSVIDLRAGFDRCEAHYQSVRADMEYVPALDKNAPRNPLWNEELLLYNKFSNHISKVF